MLLAVLNLIQDKCYLGIIKNMAIADDGSIFISNYSQYNIYKFILRIEPLSITEKVKKEYEKTYRENWLRAKKWIKRVAAKERDQKIKGELPEIDMREVMEKQIEFPEHMPYYYNLTVDSDGNILVFVYTEENDRHTFQVYSPEGKYICESVIDPGDYKVRINSRLNTLVFFKGDLFALVTSKENKSTPLKLIKVNLSY